MNKKIPLGIAIGLICIALTVSCAVTMLAVGNRYNNILEDLPEKMNRYSLIEELDKIVDGNYYGKKNDDTFELAFAHGYIGGLGDNYSRFLTADEYAQYVSETNGNMSGIGIEFQKNKKGYIEITEVYDGSPAQSSGLSAGDVIIAFDGIMINAGNYNEMAAKLAGDKLTTVNITYTSNGKDTTVNIVKGYEAQSVSSKVYGNVGYLKISNFYSTTADRVSQEISKFTSSGLRAIVIDLRSNNSANYDAAMKTLDIFVPMNDASVPAASIVGENERVISKYATAAGEVSLPTAVLIGPKTSAAAELFAANMRDFGKAELVGSVTAGVGLKRDVFRLSGGNAVLLSVGEVRAYRSGSYNGAGVAPDLDSELKQSTNQLSKDSQFLDALTLVSPEENA